MLYSLGMRGSTPLDVAAASCIDNNELALALQEQDLEMVKQSLSVQNSIAFKPDLNTLIIFPGSEVFSRMWTSELSNATG